MNRVIAIAAEDFHPVPGRERVWQGWARVTGPCAAAGTAPVHDRGQRHTRARVSRDRGSERA